MANISALTDIATALRNKSYTTSYTLPMTGKTIADSVPKCIMSPKLLKQLVEGPTVLDATVCLDFTSLDSNFTRNNLMITRVDLRGTHISSISMGQFYECTNLTTVILNSSTTSIGQSAFWQCPALISITCLATEPPSLGSYAFSDELVAIYVPEASVDSYKAASGWSDYAKKIKKVE